MRKLPVIITLIIAMLTAPAIFGAASTKYHFRHYTTQSGLPSNCIRDLAQDSRGFIWFATDGGLVRFDGVNFTTYRLEAEYAVPQPFSEDRFVLVVYTSGEEILAGTDTNLYRYDPMTDSFSLLPITTESDSHVTGPVRSIVIDSDGDIWVSLIGKGVYRLNNDGSFRKHYALPDLNMFAGVLYEDAHGHLWLCNSQTRHTLFRYDSERDGFKEFEITTDGQPAATNSMAMTADGSGQLWLGLWNGDLLRFDPVSGIGHRFTDTGAFHIHNIAFSSPTELLIGSDAGMTKYDTATRTSVTLTKDELDPSSLSNRFVYPVMIDAEGGTWVGTFYGGVNYNPPPTNPMGLYTPSRFRNSVGGSLVCAFCENDGGEIFIGTSDGGLTLFSPTSDSFTPIPLATNSHNPQTNINALCLDGDALWIGTYADGIIRYDTRSHTSRIYTSDPGQPNSLDDASSYSIFRDKEGRIWAATTNSLHLYDRQADTFRLIRKLGSRAVCMTQDGNGDLWIATHGKGIFRHNPLHDNWKNYHFVSGKSSLPHNHVSHLSVDSDGNLWAATENGLARYNPSADSFEPVELPVDIPREIQTVVPDGSLLWLTTSRGLAFYDPRSNTAEMFREPQGGSYCQFLPASAMKASDGRIYAGSTEGFRAFYPRLSTNNSYTPPVVFTGLDVVNTPVHPGDPQLAIAIDKVDEVRLSADDYSFTIHFAALSYANPNSNHYRYMLDGFDKEWVETDSRTSASYTNIPPGTYTFRVMASNNDGVWNEQGASLKIVVTPPWYMTWWMKAVYALILLVLSFGAYKLIVRRADRMREREIARLNNAKEKEMANAKLSFFTIIAHEIRTPVSLIIGPLEKVMQSASSLPTDVKKDLDIIDRNGKRLLTLVNQLLDFKKAEQTMMAFNFRPTPIVQQVENVAMRFRPTIEQMGGTFDCRYPATEFSADVDPEAINKLVSNLVNNARKFMSDHVELVVEVNQTDGTFSISVTDNGPGISEENRRKIFKPFFQVTNGNDDTKGGTGLGLSIVSNIVEAHHGTVEVDSEVGRFTRFRATLPLRQEKGAMTDEPAHEPAPLSAGPSGKEGSRPRMLVVDDNPEMVDFLVSSFSDRYEVVTAADGTEALEKLHQYEVSMIVSDWMMPKMSGAELCRHVRDDRNLSHVPFILLTAKTDNYSKIEGMNCGADYYVEKPFSVQFLNACISNLLDIRKELQQKFASNPLEPIKTVAPNPIDNDFLTRLSGIIEENFSNPQISVEFLASSMNMSRSSLYSKIKTLTDMTPNELIQITRLKKAAQLLRETNYRVGEIGYLVGFSNSSYFSKCFKAQFGMNPAEFANRNKS